AALGGEVGRFDQVLHGYRQAVERTHDRTAIELAGALERSVGVDDCPGADQGFAVANALEMRSDDFERADLAAPEALREGGRRHAEQVAGSGHGIVLSTGSRPREKRDRRADSNASRFVVQLRCGAPTISAGTFALAATRDEDAAVQRGLGGCQSGGIAAKSISGSSSPAATASSICS